MDLGGGDAFICTECGEGFSQYPKLVEHMAIHGLNGLFSSDGLSISNGSCINASIEVALHENGMLTVVDRSVLSNFTFLFGKPSNKSLWCQPSNQEALTSSKMPGKQYAHFKCERCGQVFKTLKSLQLHLSLALCNFYSYFQRLAYWHKLSLGLLYKVNLTLFHSFISVWNLTE